jgi:hypothetical protein
LSLQILQESTTILSFESAKVYIISLDSIAKKITMVEHDEIMIFDNVAGVSEDLCGLNENLIANSLDV